MRKLDLPLGWGALIAPLCFLLVLITPSALAKEILPVEAFAHLPRIHDIALSPSGKFAAMFLNAEGSTFLLTQDLETGEKYPLTKTDNTKYVMSWLRWASDDRLLFSVYFPDRRYGITTGETRLLSTNPIQADIKVLGLPRSHSLNQEHQAQFRDNIVSMLPDDPKHILLALDLERPTIPGVYKTNVENGKRKKVQRDKSPIRHWVADQQGKVRAGLGFEPNDNRNSLWVRRTNSDKWYKVDEWKIFERPDTEPLGFGLDPQKLFIRADHNGRMAIYTMNTDSEDFARELILSDPNFDIGGALVHAPDTKEAIGISHSGSNGGVLFFGEKYALLQRSVDAALPKTSNIIIGISDDGQKYLLKAGSSDTPSKFYFGNRAESALGEFASQYPLLLDQPLSQKKYVGFKARDGLDIKGFLSLPPGRKTTNLPTIIFPHGGPMTSDDSGFDYWTQFFTNRGYAVLQPNFRGSSGYGHAFMMSAIKNYGLTMQDDLEDATHWLIEEGISDRKRICIAGASYGGYAALMGAAKTPDLFRCAISFAGMSDLVGMRNHSRNYLNKNVVRAQIGRDSDQLKATSPYYLADKISVPILLAHGDQDRIVPVKQSRDMAKALKKAGANFRYLEFEKGSHNLSVEQNRIAFFEAMDEFLAEHLPSDE